MESFVRDVQYAIRQLRRDPGFALTAILTLALGIGAMTSVFSVIRAVLLDPYPYQHADRMVHVELRSKGQADNHNLLYANESGFAAVRGLSAVEDAFSMDERSQALTAEQFPLSVRAGFYSSNLFTFMGVPAYLGRGFTSADASHAQPTPVAVLSYLFWKKQFAANRDVIGKTVELDHTVYTILGVASPRFTWGDSDVYLIQPPGVGPRHYSSIFLRIKPGVTREQLAAQLQPVVDRITQQSPGDYPPGVRVGIVTLNDEVLGRFKGGLLLLFGAVVMLLLIGCANVSILLLARGAARRHEFALRSSVGAGRGRLMQQLLTESVLLSLLGAALGVAMAYGGVHLIASHLPPDAFPHEASAGMRVNLTVLLFSTTVAILTGVLFGLSPALQLTNRQSTQQLGQTMQGGSARLAGKAYGKTTHRVLIAGQVALTMLLLATSGAAVRAFLKLYHTPLGFDPDHVFLLNVDEGKNAAKTWEAAVSRQQSMRLLAEQTPGVKGVAVSTTWYPPLGAFSSVVLLASQPNLTSAQAAVILASPEIVSTLHIPLLSGRNFTEEEIAGGMRTALVNRAFIKAYLGNAEPIGQNVRVPALKEVCSECLRSPNVDGWYQVVGVVEDARNDGLRRPTRPAVFLPYTAVVTSGMTLIGRAGSDPEIAMRTLGERLRHQYPNVYVSQARQMSWLLENQAWAAERFLANLLGAFALLALALAAAGLYSVVAYTTARRTQEIGLRMALGARRSHAMRMVVQPSLISALIGAGVGLVVAVLLSRWLSNVLEGGSGDPLTLLLLAVAFVFVASVACAVPARRAALIQPMQALRTE